MSDLAKPLPLRLPLRRSYDLVGWRAALRWLPWLLAVGFFWPPLNGDVAAILYGAQRMLAGGVLYRDILDPNPPTLFVASLLPAAAARWLGGAAQFWSVLFTLLWAGLCLGLAQRILRLGGLAGPAMLLVALFLPADQFGQREHLFMLGLAPWLACAAVRLDGGAPAPRLALAAGALAALGTVIKPYFLLVPLAVETLLWLRRARHWRDGELIALGGGLVVTAGALHAAHPAYLNVMLPFNLVHYLGLDNGGARAVLLEEGRWPLLIGLALTPLGLIQRRGALAVASAAFIAGIAIAIIQGKGWFYHLLPAWLALGGAVALRADRLDGRLVAGLWLAGLMVINPFAGQMAYKDSPAAHLTALLRSTKATDRSVLFLTSTIYPQFPAIPVAGAVQPMPWLNLWVLDSLYRDGRSQPRPLDQMGPDELDLLNAVSTGLVQGQPTWIFAGPVGAALIDPLAWVSQDPVAAAMLLNYHPVPAPRGLPEGVQAWRRTR